MGVDHDRERFRQIYVAGWRPLRSYVLRRCADPAAADDVVAEVFSVAWRRRADIPAGSEIAWLYGVARNTLLNSRRGQDRRHRLVERLATQALIDHQADNQDPIRLERLDAALAKLREDEAELLRLAHWEQLSHAEIAVVLDCSENAVAIRLHRIRRKLAAILTSDQAGTTPFSAGGLAAGSGAEH